MHTQALKQVPLFSSLSQENLETVASLMHEKTVPRSTLIINEGDDSDTLYVLVSGQAKVFLCDESGKELILNVEGEGGYFGEIALLDERPRSASVMTTESCELLMLGKNDFHRCLATHPEVAVSIIQGLTERIRMSTESMRNLGLRNVYQRIVHTLEEMGEEKGGNVIEIKRKLTHQNIADMVGSSREMVSRIMKELERGGYITNDNKKITINRKLPAGW